MSSLILASLVLIVSANTSFAQQSKERTKAELNVAKTNAVKLRIEKAFQVHDAKQKNSLNARPVKTRVKMKAEPAQIKLNKTKM